MLTWCISDTHRKHRFLNVPPDVEVVVHAGDMSNQKSPEMNANEVLDFLDWYKSLHVKYKILVAGNHDTSIERGLVSRGDIHESIIYLEHESVMIVDSHGVTRKIFGSPYTPSFGSGWAFNVPRGKLFKYWQDIPDDLDLLITHGPPKGIMDLTQYDTRLGGDGKSFFQCGCKELLDMVKTVKPRYHVFGHIHTELNCPNSGMLKINGCDTMFVNAAVSDYGRSDEEVKFKQLVNNGFIIDL
jgi:Icc-related predicted phosphoesterase